MRAVYKLTSPEAFTYERRGAGFDGVAACGATAAYVLDVGDLRPTPWEIATPTRFNSRREEVRFRTERLAMDDVMWVRGIPVTRPERTISDLVAADLDLSLVSDVFLDSLRSYGSGPFDISKLVLHAYGHEHGHEYAVEQSLCPRARRCGCNGHSNEEMGCIVKENPRMGLYFIADPDGCWVEVLRGLDDIPLEAHRAN